MSSGCCILELLAQIRILILIIDRQKLLYIKEKEEMMCRMMYGHFITILKKDRTPLQLQLFSYP